MPESHIAGTNGSLAADAAGMTLNNGSSTLAKTAPAGAPKEPIIDSQPCFSAEQVEFILEQIPGVLLQPRLSNGPWTAEFETAVARTAGVKYATAFPSETAALEAVLTALGIGPGDEVLLPAESPVSNAMAIRLAGAKPVFCDIVAASHCIDPEEITAKATAAAKAVIAVHVGGLISPEITEIAGRAEAKGLALIEDCSQAQGANWHGRAAGSIGVAGIFSFDSSQILTTGEGGAAVTNDKKLSRLVRSLQNSGRDMEAKSVSYARVGRNQRFPEISALLGLAQCRRLREAVDARNDIATYYRACLQEQAPEVAVQPVPENSVHAYRTFIVNLPEGVSCSEVRGALQRQGVPMHGCDRLPLHRQPVFADASDAAAVSNPVADEVAARSVALPTDPRITEAQRQRVVEAFLAALAHAKRLKAS